MKKKVKGSFIRLVGCGIEGGAWKWLVATGITLFGDLACGNTPSSEMGDVSFVGAPNSSQIGVGLCAIQTGPRACRRSDFLGPCAVNRRKTKHPIWVGINIMVPLLVPLNTRCRILIKDPKKDHKFDHHPHILWQRALKLRRSTKKTLLLWLVLEMFL